MLRRATRTFAKHVHSSGNWKCRQLQTLTDHNKHLSTKLSRPFSSEAETKRILKEERLRFSDFPRGTQRTPFDLPIGEKLGSFEVLQKDFIKDFGCTMYLMRHTGLGTHWFHFDSDTTNNSMSLLFRTLPDDSTGKPHILEHTVLSGSQRFPVRDPFFNMIKRSLNTYMNAWTGPDFTAYPFSTQNLTDHRNLLRVYFDAAFNPLLDPRNFRQEGWRWEMNSGNEALTINGVVFNEMKGVFESQGDYVFEHTMRHLFDGSQYGLCSGGDPAEIIQLTYEDFVEFHKKYYHPSNCTLVSYGDINPLSFLDIVEGEFLDHFDPLQFEVLPQPPSLSHTKSVHLSVPPLPQEARPGFDAQFGLSFILKDLAYDKVTQETQMDILGLQIVKVLLFDFPKSPFYKDFLETQRAGGFADVNGLEQNMFFPYFNIGLRDVHNDTQNFAQLKIDILKTLEKTAQQGFDKGLVKCVLNMIEMNAKSQKTNPGIELLESFMGYFNFQNYQGLKEAMNISETMDQIRDKIEHERYASHLIQKYFLNNHSRMDLAASPDPHFNSKTNSHLTDIILERQRTLTLADRTEIALKDTELKTYQNSIQDIEILPRLEVTDIDPSVQHTQHSLESLKGAPVLFVDEDFQGITQVQLHVDLSKVTEGLLPYINLLEQIMPELGTKNLKYDDFNERVCQLADGISVSSQITQHPSQPTHFQHWATFKMSFLDQNIEPAIDLLTDFLCNVDFKDKPRISQLLQMRASTLAAHLSDDALGYAKSASRLKYDYVGTRSNSYNETRFFLNYAKDCMKPAKTHILLDDLAINLDFLLKKIFADGNLKFLVHTGNENKKRVGKQLKRLVSGLEVSYPGFKDKQTFKKTKKSTIPLYFSQNDPDFTPQNPSTLYVIPSNTNYAVETFKTFPFEHQDTPTLQVLAELLTWKYLIPLIREQGGAYGAGCTASNHGTASFYSYRDPNSLETFNHFEKAIQGIATGRFEHSDLESAKMTLFAKLGNVRMKKSLLQGYFVSGFSEQALEAFQKQCLAVEGTQVRNLCRDLFLHQLENDATSKVVFGGPANPMEAFIARGWKVENFVDDLSLNPENY